MTPEEKAKRYDEALERARAFNNGEDVDIEVGTTFCEYIFPELKESEDERIRKELIDFVKSRLAGFPECGRFIAWLEKQGEHSIYNVPSREVILAIWDLGNEWKELTNGCISTEYGTQLDYVQKHWEESEYYLRERQNIFSKKDVDDAYLKGITDAKNEIEKQYEIIFPKLKESELTWLTRYIEEEVYSLSMDIRDNEDRIKLKNLKKSLNWLEKQGEKPQGKSALEAVKEVP